MKKILISIAVLLIAASSFAMEAPDVKVNGGVKMRGYSLDNFLDFNSSSDGDNWSVFRIQSNIAATAAFEKNVTAHVNFSNQTYSEATYKSNNFNDTDYNDTDNSALWMDNQSGKVFVDQAWIEVKKFLDTPINMKFGRQYLMYGGGFVLFTGQSQYASTAMYFDGVKLTWAVKDKMDIDLLYFKDQENNRADAVDDDMTMIGLYVTAKLLPGQQELYVLHKEDQDQKGAAPPEKNFYLIGARVSNKMSFGLDYALEGGYETGKYDDRNQIDQAAYALKADIGYTLKVKTDPRIFAGYVYLSGDGTPGDDTNNSWDSFYGGWPIYGDMLAWKYINVGTANSLSNPYPGYTVGGRIGGEVIYSNLTMGTVGVGFAPRSDVSVKLSGSMLEFIDVNPAVTDSEEFGNYYQLDAKYNYTDALSFAMYAAMIDPGDAFGPDTENAYEFFWETSLKF